MATLSGTIYKNVGNHWKLQLEWSGQQNISNNTTTITARLYWMGLTGHSEVRSTATKDLGIYIFGSWHYASGAGLAKLSAYQKKEIGSFTKIVDHQADGKVNINIGGFFDAEVTLTNVWYGRISLPTTNYDLPTIPRASTMTTSRDFTAGSDRTISISRASTTFSHKIRLYVERADAVYDYIKNVDFSTTQTSLNTSFTTTEKQEIFKHLAGRSSTSVKMILDTYSGTTLIGSNTYYGTVTAPNPSTVSTGTDRYRFIDEDFPIGIARNDSEFTHTIAIKFGTFSATATNIGSDYTFVWSEIQKQELYDQIPNANYGSGTIEITTYYGVEKVRDTTSISCQFHVRNSNPTFTADLTYKDVNNSTTTITGNNQYIIQNYSSVQVEIPSTAKATAINGANMVEYTASFNGISIVQPYVEGSTVTFNLGSTSASADSTLVVKAVDSRGNSTEVSKTVLVVPYKPPTILAKSTRLNDFERETTLEVNGSIEEINVNNVMKNALSNYAGETAPIQYRVKENTEIAVFGAWINIPNTVSGNTYDTTDVILDLDNTKSFIFEFRTTDKITSTTVTTTIDKGIPIFAISEDKSSVGIGMFPENSDCLEVKGKTYLNEDLSIYNNAGRSINLIQTDYSEGAYNYIGFSDETGLWQSYVGYASAKDGHFNINTRSGDIKLTAMVGREVISNSPLRVNGDLFVDGTAELHFDRGRTENSRIYWNASELEDFGLVLQVDNETSLVVNKPSGIIQTISYNNFGIGAGRELQFLNSSGIKFDSYGNILPRDSADLSATATWSVRAVDNAIRLLIPISTNGSQNIEINPPSNGHVTIGGGIGNIIKTKSEANLSTFGGWVNYSDYYDNIRYIKTGTGVVILKGLIKGGSGHIATLPVGCRPYNRRMFISYSDTGYSRIDVFPDGKIEQMTGTGGFLSLSPIMFYAEG